MRNQSILRKRSVFNVRLMFICVVSGFVAFAGVVHAGNVGKQWRALKLEQSAVAGGDITIYVAARGLHIVNKAFGYEIVSRAPDWNVCAFNRGRRCSFTQPLKVWMASGNLAFGHVAGSLDLDMAKAADHHVCSFSGLQCVRYKMPLAEDAIDALPNLQSMLYGKYHRIGVRRACLVTATAEPAPRELVSILTRVYRVPLSPGVPIQCGFLEDSGGTWTLKTKTWTYVNLDPDFFACPNGFQPAKSLIDVQYSGKEREGFDDVVRDLKIGQ